MMRFRGLLLAVLFVPVVARAQVTLVTIFDAFAAAVAAFIPVVAALALAVFVWGMVMYLSKTSDDNERAAGRKRMVWGVVGLFVVVSLWGIVALLQTVVGVDTGLVECPPPSIDMLGMTTETCI